MAEEVQPLFLQLVTSFFFFNSVQSSHTAEIFFFHAGCDIILYVDPSISVTLESVGENGRIYSNILIKHIIKKANK